MKNRIRKRLNKFILQIKKNFNVAKKARSYILDLIL